MTDDPRDQYGLHREDFELVMVRARVKRARCYIFAYAVGQLIGNMAACFRATFRRRKR